MWSARSSDLLETIRILNLVSPKTGVPSSDFIKIEPLSDLAGAISLSTAASAIAEVQIQGTGNWPYKKPFYLERKTFSPFITLPSEKTNLNPFIFTDEQVLLVRHGTEKAKFLAQPSVIGYQNLPQDGKMSRLPMTKELVELMKCAGTCAASELQSPHLSCVYMTPSTGNGLRLLSTNLKVVFSAKIQLEKTIQESLPFPLGMLDVLNADGLKSLRWTTKLVVGRFGTGVVWQPVSEVATTDFPVQDIMESLKAVRKEELTVFELSAYKFAKLMEKLAYYLQGVRVEDWALKLRGKNGGNKLEVSSELPTVQFRDLISARIRKDFSFDWPLSMIEPVMKFIGKESEKVMLKVGLEKDGSKSYLRCGNIEMVVPSKAI